MPTALFDRHKQRPSCRSLRSLGRFACGSAPHTAGVINQYDQLPTFKYETIDDDDTEIFNIIAISSDSYKLLSVWEKAECICTFTRAEVVEFIQNYIHQVKTDIQIKFGVNLNEKIDL